MNFDRFHQPCLLPWRTPLLPPITAGCWAGIGEDCRPRTTWRPLTLAGSPVLPPLRLTGGIATPTRRYHGRTLLRHSSHACATQTKKVFAHTQVRDPRVSAAACQSHVPWEFPSPWPALFLLFIWLFINIVMRKQTLVSSLTTLFIYIDLALGRMPIFSRLSRTGTSQMISARLSKNAPTVTFALDTSFPRHTSTS